LPGNMNSVRKSSWYDLITKGLANSGLQLRELQTTNGVVKRYARADEVATSGPAVAASVATAPIELPSWLRTLAPSETAAGSLLRPSDPGDGDSHQVRTGESIALRARALQRGTLVHRLLQSLPDIATDRRRDAALAYLARNADGWSDDEQKALAEGALALIADARFAPVFAPGSRAEVSIVGRLERPGAPKALVSGQIDRLVVTPSEVLIVDYKTNHAPPTLPEDAPRGYVRQLALYRAVLRKLYPQLPVRAALLWTETPELMEISAPALDTELASYHLGVTALDPARTRS
jgi:ATP-dependent helicase/nuclease subunit A